MHYMPLVQKYYYLNFNNFFSYKKHTAMKFKNIPLTDIVPDPSQPRKFFDLEKVKELAADIESNEVHTPITVRPVGGTNTYMLVVGERRYKASEMAGKKTIPAIIRILTDDEALNIQLSENLNREDVHPLEEGLAFARLMQPGVTLQQIANRFGRSVAFVHKRTQLSKLTESAQQLFFAGKFDINAAMALSRIEPRDQEEILKISAPHYRHIENMCFQCANSLEDALFSLKDAKLYPDAGACTKCPYNSANSPTLFDNQKEKICTRSSCFAIKTQKAYRKLLQTNIIEGGLIPIATYSNNDEDEKRFLAIAKEMGIEPVDRKIYLDLYKPYEPDPKQTFEEYLEYQNYDIGDPAQEKEARDNYRDYEKEYQEELSQYQQELDEYNLQDPNDRQALVIAGNNVGTILKIRLRTETGVTASNGSSISINPEDDAIIAQLLIKEKENEKKDVAVLYEHLKKIVNQGPLPEDMMPPVPGEHYSLEDWLTTSNRSQPVINAMVIYHKIGWQYRERVKLILTGSTESSDDELFQAMQFNESHALLVCIRYLVADHLFPPYSTYQDWILKASQLWMETYMPTVMHQETAIHNTTITARKEKLEKRIQALRRKAKNTLQNEFSETN